MKSFWNSPIAIVWITTRRRSFSDLISRRMSSATSRLVDRQPAVRDQVADDLRGRRDPHDRDRRVQKDFMQKLAEQTARGVFVDLGK